MSIRLSAVRAAILLALLPAAVAAQGPLTPNTLKLDDSAKRPRATLSDVALLAGHWHGPFLGATAEEVWLPAAGGQMAGIARIFKQDAVVFYELMVFVEEEGSVSMKLKHFGPELKGWEEKNDVVTFRLVKADAHGVWFEGLTFRRQPDGGLQGFVAFRQKDGTHREEAFVYRPVGK